MSTAARISLALTVCSFLALCGVIFASTVVTHGRTVQESNFWMMAGCDELCLHHEANPRAEITRASKQAERRDTRRADRLGRQADRHHRRLPAQARRERQRSVPRAVPRSAEGGVNPGWSATAARFRQHERALVTGASSVWCCSMRPNNCSSGPPFNFGRCDVRQSKVLT